MTKSNYPQGESVNDCPIPNRVECLIAMRKRTSKVAAKYYSDAARKSRFFSVQTFYWAAAQRIIQTRDAKSGTRGAKSSPAQLFGAKKRAAWRLDRRE